MEGNISKQLRSKLKIIGRDLERLDLTVSLRRKHTINMNLRRKACFID